MPHRTILHRIKKAGMPPGSLIHLGEIHQSLVTISLTEYSSDSSTTATLHALTGYSLRPSPLKTWIHICGIHDINVMRQLESIFNLHPLALEDILNTSQRPKIDLYENQLLIILRFLSHAADGHLRDEQVSIILGDHYLISFVEREIDLFTPIEKRITSPNSRLREHEVDYLCYSIIDSIIDQQFTVLREFDEEMEVVEGLLLGNTAQITLQRIQKAKRDLSLIHKAIWPMRDIANQLIRNDSSLIRPATRIYFHDVYDHIIQSIDSVEVFREITFGLVDLYMSYNTQKLNEIMKVLTVVSTIFAPLTFITSLYGMNFENMPGLHSHWGFLFCLVTMFASATTMLLFFRKKHWI